MHGWSEERANGAGRTRVRARRYGVPHPVTGRRSKGSSTHSARAAAQKAPRGALTAIDWGEAAVRHTAATLMVEAGALLPAVSKRLGHTRISTTTGHYGRSSLRMDDAAAIQQALHG